MSHIRNISVAQEEHVSLPDLAEKVNECRKIVLNSNRPDRIATMQMLIKNIRRELNTKSTLEAALHLCNKMKDDSAMHILILGTAGIMIDKNI